ncbi:hypothetical protein J4Q44_G00343130 [Coregonus suidteri]|uniref:Uncharacterized protein n=1 Tax=Coregonus suidteri TaxID=861788 RepID=A0AAN8QMI1_9TELE
MFTPGTLCCKPEDAKAVASKKKDEILQKVRAVMISSIAGNIERTRREEKDIAQRNIVEAEGRGVFSRWSRGSRPPSPPCRPLSRQPVPSAFTELKAFCSTNEAKFQLLRRLSDRVCTNDMLNSTILVVSVGSWGWDELLRHCECCGRGSCATLRRTRAIRPWPGRTPSFTHTAFDMLQNYSKAFSKAHLQLQVFQLRNEAQQIMEQIKSLQKEKLQPYRIEIAKDARRAETLTSEFEASIYTPAMALVRCSEDVIHTLAEILPPGDAQTREEWVQVLDRLKENFHSAVELPNQTLRAVSDFYHYYNKANSWYNIVLCENFLQALLWGVNCDRLPKRRHPLEMHGPVPVWRQAVCDFLRNNPSPDMEELVQLAHLANVIPDTQLQQTGKRLSQRCMTLCKLLTCPGAVPINDLQLALQWQYEFLRASHRKGPGPQTNLPVGRGPEAIHSIPDAMWCHSRTSGSRSDCHTKDNMHSHGSPSNLKHHQAPLGTAPSSAVSGAVTAVGKPPSLSSFDSGFDGAGSGHMETGAGREGWEGLSRVPGTRQPQIHKENISSVSDSEDRREEFDFGSVGSTSRASIQIIPKITVDSMHFEIKLKRSATLPQNPWLSLPVEDLENSYTVTITQNPSQSPHPRDVKSPNPSECSHHSDRSSNWSRDQPSQTEVQTSPQSRGAQPRILQAHDSFDDSDLSPVRNALSSTIADARDGPNYTAESAPTLLWDTYDFHNPKQDTCERITSSMTEVSLNDWDLKEQEGLREVEEILDRAAGILEEEENVMAQEHMLAVLLKTESTNKPWESWGSETQISVMSSCDLKAHGVLGLDDSLASADNDNQSECRSPEAASETEASEHSMCHNGRLMETGLTGLMSPQISRGELLKELRGLHVLDELIMEENLKLHELRRAEKQCLDEKPPQSASSRITSGSCEPSGADEWREVEVPDGFQRRGTARRSPVNQPNHHITTRDMNNFKTAIVLDTGSGLMKAGFADQDLPTTVFPNIIGLPKYEEIMNGILERETYIGHEAQHMRGVLALKYPMKNGIIRNWDEMEKIWHHTFQQLHVEPDDHPVLLTEAAMNPLENRQRMVELMFECFNVPLTYVAMQAVLALYAAGRTTGVVFDSGDGVSHSVPVFEGYCLPHAVQRCTLAGHDVTMHLKKLLQEQGVCMRTSAEMEIVREMKEKCCQVSQDYESELTCGGSASSEMYYTMPDGQVVRLSTERFRAPEILFKPELIGRDHYGMHESIFKSILSSDIDLRRSFLGNIVLSGGNTLLAGLPERLQSEIRTMVPTDLGECVKVTSPKDRDFSVWSGGAVLANLSSFASAWISQEEYEEYGPQIVFRKCF